MEGKVRFFSNDGDLFTVANGNKKFELEAKGGVKATYAANVRDYVVSIARKKFAELFTKKFDFLSVEYKEFVKGGIVSMKLENRINVLGEEELVVKTVNVNKEENDYIFIDNKIVSEESDKNSFEFVSGQLEAILKNL